MTATLTDDAGNGLSQHSVLFTITPTGGGSPAYQQSTIADQSGNVQLSVPVLQAGSYTIAARYNGAIGSGSNAITESDPSFGPSSADLALTVSPAPLTVTANSPSACEYSDATPSFSGTLSGVVNGDNITAAYGSSGSCSSTPGTYAIVPTLSDPGNKLGNYAVTYNNGTLTVTQEEAGLAYTGPAVVADGGTVNLSAVITSDPGESGSAPVANYSIAPGAMTFTLGSQTCSPTGSTDSTGRIGCTIAGVTAPPGSVSVKVTFGDANYSSVTWSGTISVAGVYALDPSISAALSTSGNACILSGGPILVNSSSSTAVQAGTGCNGSSISPTPTKQSVSDPLASLTMPSYANGAWTVPGQTAPVTQTFSTSTTTLKPGVYVGGISLTGSGSYTLQPGVYILDGGGLKVDGTSTLTGSGVFIYNTNHSGACGAISLAGGSSTSLTAPTSGPYQNLALAQDRGCTTAATLGGTTTSPVGKLGTTGSIYLPAALLQVTGNASYNGANASIIADAIQASGNGVLKVNHA